MIGDGETGFLDKLLLEAAGKPEEADERVLVPVRKDERHARDREAEGAGVHDGSRGKMDLFLREMNPDHSVGDGKLCAPEEAEVVGVRSPNFSGTTPCF